MAGVEATTNRSTTSASRTTRPNRSFAARSAAAWNTARWTRRPAASATVSCTMRARARPRVRGLATGLISPSSSRNTGLMSSRVAAYAWILLTRPDRFRNSNVSMAPSTRTRPAISLALADTSSSAPPAWAARAASTATNPSPMVALPESTTSTRPSNCSAARRAWRLAAESPADRVTHTISSAPAARYASR